MHPDTVGRPQQQNYRFPRVLNISLPSTRGVQCRPDLKLGGSESAPYAGSSPAFEGVPG